MTTKNTENFVFLSYAREDSSVATKLYRSLTDRGFKVWFDQVSLIAGQRWEIAISKAIKRSTAFVALLSMNSLSKRGFIHKELSAAFNVLEELPKGEIFIIPVRLDDSLVEDDRLIGLHWIDLFQEWEGGVEKIVQALKNKGMKIPTQNRGASALKRILETRSLTVGVPHYPPLVDFKGEGDKIQSYGLYFEMLEIIAKKYELHLELCSYSLSTCVDAITNNEFDIALSVFKTISRAKRADFTAALHLVNVTGVGRIEDNRVQTLADLQNERIRIVVAKGEIGEEILCDYIEIENINERLIEVGTDNISEIITLVATGVADIAVADSLSCHNYLSTYGGNTLKHLFRDNPLYICPNAIMIPIGQNVLRDWLNREFREARNNPYIVRSESQILRELKGIIERVV
jgi:ABC-type amino acid transport substrate-binding protein